MDQYRFYFPVQVRWMDLDTQWHVNNARFLSFFESARLEYLVKLGLFDNRSFHDLKLIVADVHIAYKAPIDLGQNIRVGVRVTRIGNKSMVFDEVIEDVDTGKVLASSDIIMVTYEYRTRTAIPVPDDWRKAISTFEGLTG